MDRLFGKPIILFYATGWRNSFFNFCQVDAVFLDLALLRLAFLEIMTIIMTIWSYPLAI